MTTSPRKVRTSTKREPRGNEGKGRKKGVPNKVTRTAKEAIAMLADGMTGELQDWLRASAYGVAELWRVWEPPEGDPDAEPPVGAEVAGRGKGAKALVRMRKDGKAMTASLVDIMDGSLPDGAIVRWVTKPDPGGATDTMLRALEYHIPKLSRSEVTGAGGKDLIPATINVVGKKAPSRE